METKLKILGFAGSLRVGSYNKALLRAATELFPESTTLEIFDLDGIPPFNQHQALDSLAWDSRWYGTGSRTILYPYGMSKEQYRLLCELRLKVGNYVHNKFCRTSLKFLFSRLRESSAAHVGQK